MSIVEKPAGLKGSLQTNSAATYEICSMEGFISRPFCSTHLTPAIETESTPEVSSGYNGNGNHDKEKGGEEAQVEGDEERA